MTANITIVPRGCLDKEVIMLPCKGPEEVVLYQFSIVNRLKCNDILTKVTATSNEETVKITDITVDGQTFNCFISGGILNTSVCIYFVTHTQNGEVRTFNATLPINPTGVAGYDPTRNQVIIVGPQGEKGEPGKDGRDGANGKDGDKGDKGDTGEPGATGPQGERGVAGQNGVDGKDGSPGIQGAQGLPGKDGANGEKGEPGPKGNSLNFLTGKKIAFFGDSITAYKDASVGKGAYPFGDVTNVDLTWWKQVATKTEATISTNNSYGGTCISNPEWLGNNTSLLTRISTLPTDTDICITLMGVNDFRNGIGLGTIDYTKTTWSVGFFGDAVCKAMIDMNTQSPKTRFVWIGILGDFTGGYKASQSKNGSGLTVSQYNTIIQNCCKQYGNLYIDPTEAFSYLSQNCFLDGLHPNAWGMKCLANYVINKITNIL